MRMLTRRTGFVLPGVTGGPAFPVFNQIQNLYRIG